MTARAITPAIRHGALAVLPRATDLVTRRVQSGRRLTCDKTGRDWPIADRADGIATARRLGLTDFSMTGLLPEAQDLPTRR